MILITGGLGFIGTHTARALLDLGESCVLVQRRPPGQPLPSPLAGEPDGRVIVEQADVHDIEALAGVGERHGITGVVHLAFGPWPTGEDPIADTRAGISGLLNVLDAARRWGVSRVGVASTIGVYGGAPGADSGEPLGEQTPLPMATGHFIPFMKKLGELAGDYIAGHSDNLRVHSMRIGGAWGPLGRPASPFFGAAQLVHAAARGTAPDFSSVHATPYAENGLDLCYVKDVGRAIALLQTAPSLGHGTYNVASGRVTTYADLVDALGKAGSDVRIDLPAGRDPAGPAHDLRLDISRLREDTGFEPEFDAERAVADYLAWLHRGNER
ncbi:MAG: NAD-dependent epimerase/dehydratase family protein [Actinocrinis sp.]